MSERKPKSLFKQSTSASNAKTTLESIQKPTPLKYTKLKQEVLPVRNLLPEFQKMQPTPTKFEKKNQGKLEHQNKHQIDDSSEISSQLNAQSIIEIHLKQEDYHFQLPRSYIIAMSGLQQAVLQRDSQIKNLAISLEQLNKRRIVSEQKVQELLIKVKQLDKSKIQLLAQVKLLKDLNFQEKQKQGKNQNLKNELQLELALLKQRSSTQIVQLTKQVNFLENEKSKSSKQCFQLKSEKKKIYAQYEVLKHQIIQDKKSFNQAIKIKEDQIENLKKQLEKEREAKINDEKEAIILKNQLNLLAQRAVIAERQHQQSLRTQKQFHQSIQDKQRIPLIDVSVKNKSKEITSKLQAKIKHQAQNSNDTYNQHSKKATQNQFVSRERSTSRLKVTQNRPQIVSQYRQLLRYEKESIALNYQLELLQKGLAGQIFGEGRTQLQRSYQKLKRQCEQKQLQIRQLKCFLNDAGR